MENRLSSSENVSEGDYSTSDYFLDSRQEHSTKSYEQKNVSDWYYPTSEYYVDNSQGYSTKLSEQQNVSEWNYSTSEYYLDSSQGYSTKSSEQQNVSEWNFSTSKYYQDSSQGYRTKSSEHKNTHQFKNSADFSQSMENDDDDVDGGYSLEVKKRAIIACYNEKIQERMDDKKSHGLRRNVLLYNAFAVLLKNLEEQQ